MFTLDKLNLADLRLLFLVVNFKVNLSESLRRKFLSIPPLSRKSTYLELSEQPTIKLNLECFEYVAPYVFMQGVTNKIRQNLTACIKPKVNTFSRITRCPKMPRYRDIDTQILG